MNLSKLLIPVILLMLVPKINPAQGVPQKEMDALKDLYNSLNGDSWSDHQYWLTMYHPSSWYGVDVINGHVTGINLSYNNLSGSVPASIKDLEYLEILNLSYNQNITSIPPEIGELKKLTWLEASGNQLEKIPEEISNLPALQKLSFEKNKINQPLPAWLGKNTALKELDLSFNQLYGNIPAEFSSLKNLEYLDLTHNKLDGIIPSFLGTFNLKMLRLGQNYFEGSIPKELGNLTHLHDLFLAYNMLEGEIPKEIGQLANLESLSLHYNRLTGSIPREIGNLVKLISLQLSHNALSGSLPADMGNLKNLIGLYLSDNKLGWDINGIVIKGRLIPDELKEMSALQILGIANNRIQFGDIEPIFSWPIFKNFIEFQYRQCQQCFEENSIYAHTGDSVKINILNYNPAPSDTYQWLKDGKQIAGANDSTLMINEISPINTGTYQCRITNSVATETSMILSSTHLNIGNKISIPVPEFMALKELYQSTNGAFWNMNDHWLDTTNFTVNDWWGVEVKDGHVSALKLGGNQLRGALPASIKNLEHLEILDLHLNGGITSVPPEIGALKSLVTLDLSSNLLQELPEEIGTLTNLEFLDLAANKLEQTVPAWLGNLTSLKYLSLSNNKFYGNVPSGFMNLSNLTHLKINGTELEGDLPLYLFDFLNLKHLDLGRNRFTGNIPKEIGKLVNLEYLNFGSNALDDGYLPPEIGNLIHLQELNLQFCALNGNIPPEIGNLTALKGLFLDFNRFTGALPAEMGNLKNLTALGLMANWIGWGNGGVIEKRYERLIPDELKEMTSLTYFNIEQNRIQFNDIEPVFSWPAFGNPLQFLYSQEEGLHEHTNIYAKKGDTIKISILNYYPAPSDTYQWLKDGNPIEGANDSILVISGVQFEDEGGYQCRISNSVATGSSSILSYTAFMVRGKSDVPVSEYNALKDLYQSMNGTSWKNNDHWLDTINYAVNDWWGIEVEGGHVQSIKLDTNNVSGVIPSSVGNLPYLLNLNLYDNHVSGAIPETLTKISYLHSLILSHNNLSGPIPDFLGRIKTLNYLWLDHNNFTGPIPSNLGNLPYLSYLYLSNNALTGTVPASFGNLSQLRQLLLNDNYLNGPLPPELQNLKRLYSFNIENNLLGNQTGLQKVAVIEGERQIPDELATLIEMDTLYLGGNNLQFNDIEAIFGWENFSNIKDFVYYPQDSIGMNANIVGVSGEELLLTIHNYYTGPSDAVQWYKNDTLIEGANEAELVFNPLHISDSGRYHMEVTNPVAKDLILVSKPVNLHVMLPSSSKSLMSSKIKVYPNPANVKIYISAPGESLNLSVFNPAGEIFMQKEIEHPGWLDITNLPPGVYYFQFINHEAMKWVKKVVVL